MATALEQNTTDSLDNIRTHFLSLQRSERTKKAYRVDLEQFFASLESSEDDFSVFMALPYAHMLNRMVRFLSSVEKRDPDTGHVLNANTVNRKRSTLVSFFQYLQDAYDYPKNPARKIPLHPKSEFSNTPLLSKSEVLRIMHFLKQHHREGERQFRNYLIVLGLFHFALRRQELATLRWDQMCSSPRWHFRIRQKRNRWKLLPIPPKYRKRLNEFAEKYGQKGAFIFRPTRNNRTKILDKPISTNTILEVVHKVNQAVLPEKDIIPHSFRSSFISLARENGLDDKEIMNATGHKSSAMINYYDIRERLDANAINYFGKWIE